MANRYFSPICYLAVILVGSGSAAFAQESFFKGKTVRIIVGFTPGGGYDTYARLIGRHLGKHVPGNPTVVVENMPGAGSLISANYVYKIAKPDGLTMAHFIGGLFLQQLLGKPGVEFDSPKFEYVGVPVQDEFAIGISRETGITNIEQWFASKTPVKFGGTATGSGTDDIPNVLKTALGLPVQVVTGYKGSSDIRLAFNSGEIHGFSNGWQSTKATWSKELESGLMRIVLQVNSKSHPELTHVPLAIDFAKTDEAKKLLQVITQVHGASVRPFVLPPGTPKDRVQLLRRAFIDSLKDPELLAEAAKARLDIGPLNGDELAKSVAEIFKVDAAITARLKEILK
jgi:tripartite-type tricarboxylate transporter receptor subunit TctC